MYHRCLLLFVVDDVHVPDEVIVPGTPEGTLGTLVRLLPSVCQLVTAEISALAKHFRTELTHDGARTLRSSWDRGKQARHIQVIASLQ